MAALRRFEWLAFLFVFAVILCVVQERPDSGYEFQGDDTRYINYAVTLHKYGIFGFSGEGFTMPPVPGNANGPLYPAFITGVMALDPALAESLSCVVEKGIEAGCPENFTSLYIAQAFLALITLALIYLIARRYSGSSAMGWIASLLAVASGILTEFSAFFLTEILMLPIFCALTLFCLELYRQGKMRWIVAIGIALALLTLIRPSYLYLLYGFFLFFIALAVFKRRTLEIKRLGVLAVVFVLTVLPWAVRNKIHFDSYTLTSGGYAEAILIQRTNYNQMSWPEVGAAFIYWFPDFGDSLAKNIFPEELVGKLGWGEGSYYAQGYHESIMALDKKLGGRDKILPYLVKEEVLTLKHVAVTAPLTMRGIFIAKYWGVFGFVATLVLLIGTLRRRNYGLLVMLLPPLYMAVLHAGISVSIPRYNLPLISLYALSMAWYISLYGNKLVSKFRPS